MQLQMTESDKKLITFLAVFVIIVAGGYWGVYPVVKNIMAYDEQILDEQATMEMNEIKLVQVSMLEIEQEEIAAEMADLKNSFYPMMTSDQIDKYMTGLILDYNLYSYELSIQMPQEEAKTEAYQYSVKAAEDALAAEEEEASSMEDLLSLEDEETENPEEMSLAAIDYEVSSGVYEVNIRMRVGGEKEQLEQLIDDLSASDQKLHLTGYSWDEQRSVSYQEDGDIALEVEKILTISVSLYMCEDIL